jgi:tRNA dimethylallyltransferase
VNNSVIILLGPTGVGKTGVSIALSKALNTEIISADSMLLYKYMDIATAKPTMDEQEAVKHHLIDILAPDESFSAGLFREEALKLITKLHKESKIPLIVGGTGLYIRTLTQGLFKGPDADWDLRANLLEQEEQLGTGFLYGELKKIDSEAAHIIHPSDIRRIVRALEIRIKEKKNFAAIRSETAETPFQFIKVGLQRKREELYEIINTRVDKMIEQGLVEETIKLSKMKLGNTALQALGFKEINMYLSGNISLDEAITLLKTRTRRYAKRQLTWFRKEPYIHWVDITGLYKSSEIFQKILKDVEFVRKIIYYEKKP